MPAGIMVGTPITFSAVFDTAKIVDYTAGVNAAIPAVAAFRSVRTASLSDDPLASLTITIGPVTFTKFDGVNDGTPCGDTPLSTCRNPASPTGGLGAGNLPDVEYLNGSFAGVGNISINSLGYTLDADPVADAIQRATQGYAFHLPATTGNFDFVLSSGTAASPFAQRFTVGNIDITSVQVSAVPEPTSWMLLLGGVAMLASRKLRSSSADPGGRAVHQPAHGHDPYLPTWRA